jgi:hypothetical protein
MDSYTRLMFCASCVFAAIFSSILSRIMPPTIAAPLAMFIGSWWMRSIDPVGKQFRTHIEKLFEENKRFILCAAHALMLGITTATVLARVTDPIIATLAGTIVSRIFMYGAMR